jgi:hypothetical protein
MAPILKHRMPIGKDKFAAAYSQLKTQSYLDPAARGAGSHRQVPTSSSYSSPEFRLSTHDWSRVPTLML